MDHVLKSSWNQSNFTAFIIQLKRTYVACYLHIDIYIYPYYTGGAVLNSIPPPKSLRLSIY